MNWTYRAKEKSYHQFQHDILQRRVSQVDGHHILIHAIAGKIRPAIRSIPFLRISCIFFRHREPERGYFECACDCLHHIHRCSPPMTTIYYRRSQLDTWCEYKDASLDHIREVRIAHWPVPSNCDREFEFLDDNRISTMNSIPPIRNLVSESLDVVCWSELWSADVSLSVLL